MKDKYLGSLLKAIAITSLLSLAACGGSSSSDGSDDSTINISGAMSDVDGNPVAGVTITSKKASDDSIVGTTTTASDGSYSVVAPSATEFYLHATANSYVPSNTQIVDFDSDQSDADIPIISIAQADILAPLIDGSANWNAASSKGWIAIDFYYGDEDDGEKITAVANPSIDVKYNHCDGTFGAGPTPSPVCADRMGPMVMATSSTEGNIEFTVSGTGDNTASTVNGGTQKVKLPLRLGELSYAEVWIDENTSSSSTSTVAISGTVEDKESGAMLAGVTIKAKSPSDDSELASAVTDNNGAYTVNVPAGQDFYLHATGQPDYRGTFNLNGTFYVSGNLQIENETADRSGIKIYLGTATLIGTVFPSVGINTGTDAMFAMDVVTPSDDDIAGISLGTSPSTMSGIFYQQDNGSFLSSGQTTMQSGPSILGYVVAPASNATYTFTLYEGSNLSTAGQTIDTSFKLRLIPGELSEPIEP